MQTEPADANHRRVRIVVEGEVTEDALFRRRRAKPRIPPEMRPHRRLHELEPFDRHRHERPFGCDAQRGGPEELQEAIEQHRVNPVRSGISGVERKAQLAEHITATAP